MNSDTPNHLISVYGRYPKSSTGSILKEIQHLIYRNDLNIEKALKEVVTLHMRVSKSSNAYGDSLKLTSDFVNSKQKQNNLQAFTPPPSLQKKITQTEWNTETQYRVPLCVP